MEWCCFGSFACVLLPIIHLLLELFGLLLVNKRQSCQTFLKLKRVKERSILVVVKRVIDLLVPYHTSIGTLLLMSVCLCETCKETYRDVDHFNPICISNQIVGQNSCALKPCVNPSLLVRISYVESSHGNRTDLVRMLGYCTLDNFFVMLGQNRWHFRRVSLRHLALIWLNG